jgi:transcriptional regulator with XRE-family HTH domain
MNLLDRLEMLMASKGINKKQLAEALGLTTSTVYSWWYRGWEEITLPKLRLLKNYFGCTLDWLCCGDEETESMTVLTAEESQLLAAYHSADPGTQAAVCKLLDIAPPSEERSAM